MPQDALTYRHIAFELDSILKGGRIDKISMPFFDTVVLCVYANKKNHSLVISCNPSRPFCHLTKNSFVNLAVAPSFLMHLRKHILGGKIERIETVFNERIIKIFIDARSELQLFETKVLTVELMGKHSNIILVNENNSVSDCLHKISPDLSAKRVLLPGMTYQTVERIGGLDSFAKGDITRLLGAFEGGNLVSYIQGSLGGLSRDSVNHALYKTYSSLNPSDFSACKFDTLATNILLLLMEKKLSPCVAFVENEAKDFYAFPYSFLDSSTLKFFDSLNEAADFYYTGRLKNEGEKQLFNRLNSALCSYIKRQEKKLGMVLEREDSALGFETDRLFGELITANIFAIKKGMGTAEVANYYEESSPKLSIPLDVFLSPQANAQKYFKQYNKKKRTFSVCKEQKQKLLDELLYLNGILNSLKMFDGLDSLNEIKRELEQIGVLKEKVKVKGNNKKAKDKPSFLNFLSFVVDDYVVTIGKNNLQNEQLYKTAKPFDLWLHVKDEHGSHVVVSNKDKDFPPDNVLLTAARAAAYYSKARGADKVAVDYTFYKNVSKPAGAALGLVNYEHQYTVFVKPENY